jgi:predicted RNA-binding protein YlxR (DUF448 family)
MAKVRKVPMRQCTGCLTVRPKKELVRVVRTPEGEVVLDFTGKRSGRGAYICPDVNCLAEAHKRGRLSKSLEVPIDQETWEQLEQACIDRQAGGQAKR